jgi:hypothetical protein
VITAHPELWPGLDDPSEDDRAWFHQHPDAVVRLRPQFPEEAAARDAMAKATGAPCMITIQHLKEERPQTWMAVVDILRLRGIPHGEDGASGRIRFECPEPTSKELGDDIAYTAAAMVLSWLEQSKRHRPRRKSKGFA